ncbi:MAG: type II secretion system F family protein [Clostridium sp.]|nr:type II secretion system F family protein [Clostridium sp.]
MLEIGKASLVVAALAYFFYRSVWAVIPLAAVGVLFFHKERDRKVKAFGEELNLQFKECLLCVATLLKAGYAVENAFVESRKDMKLLYGEESSIYMELEGIRRGLVINITLEELLADLAERSTGDDIPQFASVFAIAKRNGGNLSEIIQTTASLISRKMDAKQEIRTQLSGRQMEQTIMKLMPFGILLYIGCSNPGYFDPLYHNGQGILIMTVCLGVYIGAYVLGDRILERIAAKMV